MPLPEAWRLPPAPVLEPEEAVASFRVQPGYRVELVASEPLIEDPVQAVFDGDGRLWVVEMIGFMPDADGNDELDEVCRISVLEDLDGDGRMDRATRFLEDLVLPRAVGFARGGILVLEPPDLYLCRDTDGDGEADRREVVASGFPGLHNPEHAPNGLLRGLDNWIHLAKHGAAYRQDAEGGWILRRQPAEGQWGLTQDDWGRLFHNHNSDLLRGDLIPARLALGNPHLRRVNGVNVSVARDQRVWPVRPTPGVNRGYRQGTLRADGTLARVTAACGPLIYRGDLLRDYRGHAFVCEPAGNLVKALRLAETPDGRLEARPFEEGREFLASTDERFRPVNLVDGPDGALYVVDFYRGILQHRIYMTTWLRRQVEERGLDQPVGLGRIWRVVPEDAAPPPRRRPALEQAPAQELAAALRSPNGWLRDTAQRILVDRRLVAAEPALRRLLEDTGTPAVTRVHALWTLEGLGLLGLEDLVPFLAPGGVRPEEREPVVQALRILAERPPGTAALPAMTARLRSLVGHPSARVRRHLALALGPLRFEGRRDLLRQLLQSAAASDDAVLRDAALTALPGEELDLLLSLDPEVFADPRGAAAGVVKALAECVAREEDPVRLRRLVEALLDAGRRPAWRRAALDGLLATRPLDREGGLPPRYRRFRLDREVDLAGIEELGSALGDPPRAALLDALLDWPGRLLPEERRPEPTPEERRRIAAGQALFEITCASCHGFQGEGQEGQAPPFEDSEWVWGPEERLVRIVLHGLRGPVEVAGREWDLEMASLELLDDRQVAEILSYVRSRWGQGAPLIVPETVTRIREQERGRMQPWTAEELLRLPGGGD